MIEDSYNKQLLAKQEEKQEERGSCQPLQAFVQNDENFKNILGNEK